MDRKDFGSEQTPSIDRITSFVDLKWRSGFVMIEISSCTCLFIEVVFSLSGFGLE